MHSDSSPESRVKFIYFVFFKNKGHKFLQKLLVLAHLTQGGATAGDATIKIVENEPTCTGGSQVSLLLFVFNLD